MYQRAGTSSGGGGELWNTFSQSGANTVSSAISTGLTSISRLVIYWTGNTSVNLYGAMVYDVNKSSSKHFTGGANTSTAQGYFSNIGDNTNNNQAAKIMSVSSGSFTIKNPNVADTYDYYWYAE